MTAFRIKGLQNQTESIFIRACFLIRPMRDGESKDSSLV